MILYMNTKEFFKYFLKNERDDDILNCQYVVISNRIRRSGSDYSKEVRQLVSENILIVKSLFPSTNVCQALTDDDFHERYMDQLKISNRALIASIVKYSIDEMKNVILICTKKEDKMKFLQDISIHIQEEYGVPVFNYSYYSYMATDEELHNFDREKALKKCNKVLEEVKKDALLNGFSGFDSNNTPKKYVKETYGTKQKDEIKKILKKKGLYHKGMDKDEMLDTIEVYLDRFL